MIVRVYPWVMYGAICLLPVVFGCGSDHPMPSATDIEGTSNVSVPVEHYIELGDLPDLQGRGVLRVLLPKAIQGTGYLPRRGYPLHSEIEIVKAFSNVLGIATMWVYVEKRQDLIPYLLAGKGDLIAANLTVTAARKQQITFSVPIATVREQVVTRTKDPLKTPAGLAGRTVALHRSSAFWQTMEGLRKNYPAIKIQVVPEHISTAAILEGVADGEYDVAIADSNLIESIVTYHKQLRVAFDVGGDRAIAWGVRSQSTHLIKALNTFLNQEKLTDKQYVTYLDDLPGIKQRKVIRVLTRNNAATYFLWRGELLGFEYELVRRFAKGHGLRVEMVVPPAREDLIPWLLEGKGDIIAASLTATEQRRKQGVAFSRMYNKVSEVLVARAEEKELKRPQDLAGRTVVVRRSSSYWDTLQRLKKSGIALILQAAPEDLETEEIIDRVATGEYDVTVSDSHILDIELTWRTGIKAAFPLDQPVVHGWVVRKDDNRLLQAANTFLQKEYRGLFYNITYKKYFKNPRKIRKHVEQRVDRIEGGQLSPYDDLVRKFSKQYGFDWRLVVAQMYQESRFDPNAKSWVGALGLMQVMPRTAREFDFFNLSEPSVGIHAGVRYLYWLTKRFDPELAVQDRMWFMLASYNAGFGHVRDARRLAKKMGWAPNRWFDHVERAMLLLAKRKYASQARYGYVRGSEPVKYVREIRDRYNAYVRLTQALKN